MAEERYWGRSGVGKRVLADAEVRTLMLDRSRSRQDGDSQLDTMVLIEEERVRGNPLGSLFVLAAPQLPRAEAISDLLYGPQATARLLKLTREIHQAQLAAGHGDFEPNLASYLTYEPRTSSAELRTISGEGEEPFWPDLLHLQLGTDGSVGIICGRGSDHFGIEDRSDGRPVQVILAPLVIGLVRSTLALAAALGDEAGYLGGWNLGIALEDIDGAVDYDLRRRGAKHTRAYTDSSYRRTTTASTGELVDAPGTVTGRLLLPLLRALDAAAVHQPRLTDPATTAVTP